MKRRFFKMTILLSLAFCLLFAISCVANAEEIGSGVCGMNATWTLDSDGTLTVSGKGIVCDDYYENYFHDVKNVITSVDIKPGITGIGPSAFADCVNLESVKMADSVTSIDQWAFLQCNNLSEIELSKGLITIGVEAFVSCVNLSSIEIPEGVISIGNGAFDSCTQLSGIEFPDSVLSIGGVTFQNCESLSYVKLPKNLKSIDGFTFSGCKSLVSIEIPESVTSIGEYAFQSCHSLASIDIPDSVKTMGDHAFAYCFGLADVKLSSNIKSISSAAFYECASLSYIEIPDGVTSIGNSAFEHCSSLVDIKLPESLKTFGAYAFNNCAFEEIGIPDGILTVSDGLFLDCSNLISVKIPDSVKTIKASAFAGCTNLRAVVIPKSTVSILEYVFDGCENITIYGYKGTKAESYAKENNIPFIDVEGVNVDELFTQMKDSVQTETLGNYTLYYDGNGGIEPPSPVRCSSDGKVTVTLEKMNMEGSDFLGWSYQADSLQAEFAGGEVIEISEDTTLYAVWRSNEFDNAIVLTIDSKKSLVFGQEADNDVAPIIENSRTMLPARFVAENLGAKVEWNSSERKVIITKDSTVVEIVIDSTTAYINGVAQQLDSPAFIRDSRTYTPVRFICEALGANVEWNAKTRQVIITK